MWVKNLLLFILLNLPFDNMFSFDYKPLNENFIFALPRSFIILLISNIYPFHVIIYKKNITHLMILVLFSVEPLVEDFLPVLYHELKFH